MAAGTAATTTRAPKLAQLIAVRPGVKNDTQKGLNEAYHVLQRSELLVGLARTYTPRDDDGFKYPSESKQVLVKSTQLLDQTAKLLTRLFDLTAQMDYTNTQAKADIVLQVNGKPVTLLHDVPVSYLMFLEKQLVSIQTLLRKLPILDQTESWTYDSATDVHKTEPVSTVKLNKVRQNHVKAPATDKHPAQVDVFTEDVPVGTWSTVKYSGALPASRINVLLDRTTALMQAVKYAREQANEADLVMIKPGRDIFDYLFAPGE